MVTTWIGIQAAAVFLGNMATVVGLLLLLRVVDVVGRWWAGRHD